MAPEKCKEQSNFILRLFSQQRYSLTSSLIFFSEQDQWFKAQHWSPICPAFYVPVEVFKRYF